jgi:uncharacterized protein YfaS (alpha-2-macroglobulin family)
MKLRLLPLACLLIPLLGPAQAAATIPTETFDIWSIQEVYEERVAADPTFELRDLVAELRQDEQLTATERHTLTLVELLQLGRELAWRPEVTHELGRMQVQVQKLADQLEPIGSELYAAAEEALYRSKVPEHSYDADKAWFQHLQRAFRYWAESEQLDRARQRYIALAMDLPIRNDGRYAKSRSVEMARSLREHVRSALRLAEAPEEEAQLHWKMAQLLRASGLAESGGFTDLTEHHFDKALELTPMDAADMPVLLAEAISFHGSAGETHYRRTVELIDQYLARSGEEQMGFAYELKRMRDEIVGRKVVILAPTVVHPEKPETLSIQSRNLDNLRISLHPLPPDLFLANLVEADPPSRLTAGPVWQQSFTLKPDNMHAVSTTEFQFPASLEAGFYRLYVGGEDTWETHDLIVSRINVLIQNVGDKALVYVCDSLTGEPVENVDVALRYIAQKPRAHRTQRAPVKGNTLDQRTEVSMEATTGADGIAWFAFAGKKYSYGSLVATVLGPQPACVSAGSAYVNAQRPQSESFTLFGFTDQPAYRPGDPVNWKAILRSQTNGDLSVPESLLMTYTVVDREGNTLESGEVSTNEFGTVEGSFDIPETSRLGYWSIRFSAKDTYIRGDVTFQVEEYRLPEFSAILKLEDGPLKLGQTISGSIAASYFSGEPMPGTQVSLKVTAYQQPLRRSANDSWEPHAQIIKESTLITDLNGLAAFSFEAGYSENSAVRYEIDAAVTDSANRVREIQEYLWLYPHAFKANLYPEHTVIDEGKALRIHICTGTTRETHASLEGTLQVSRRVSSPTGYALESVYKTVIKTGGNGHATVEVPALSAGEYELEWTSPETQSHSEHSVLVGTPDAVFGHTGIELVMDVHTSDGCAIGQQRHNRDVFHDRGTTIPYAIIRTGKGNHALAVVNDRTQFNRVAVVPLNQPVTRFDLSLDGAVEKKAVVSINGFADGQQFYSWKGVTSDIQWNPLDLSIERKESSPALPGSEQQLDIQVKRYDGSLAEGVEVSIAVFDDALSIFERNRAMDQLTPSYFVTPFGFKQPVSGNARRPPYSDSNRSLSIRVPFWNGEYGGGGVYGSGGGGDEVFELSAFMVITDLDEYRLEPGFPASEEEHMVGTNESSFEFDSLLADLSQVGLRPVVFRKDFRKGAFWTGSSVTDNQGRLRVRFLLPESLTRWRVEATAAAATPEVGSASATFTASLPVTGRLALPRFLVVGDEADLSVIAANYTETSLEVVAGLRIDAHLAGETTPQSLTLAPDASGRFDWRVKAVAAGTSTVTSAVLSEAHSDGMERSLEIIEHGFAQRIIRRDTVTDEVTRLKLRMPDAVAPDSVSMQITMEAGLAPVILRALPYLVDYPYQCTEQTISRLVPVWLMKEKLSPLVQDPSRVLAAMGIESRSAFDAFLTGNTDHLLELQKNGVWGWFNSDYPDDYMTAYALWGLTFLQEAGVDLEDSFYLENTIDHLSSVLEKYALNPDMHLWLMYVLSKANPERSTKGSGDDLPDLLKRYHTAARTLEPAALSWLIMALEYNGFSTSAAQLMPLLCKKATQAQEPGTGVMTAHWGRNPEHYHTWRTHPTETTAWAVMAINLVDPESPLIEPALNWLTAERTSGQWESTRTTMIALMALESARVNREPPDGSAEITIEANGKDMEVLELDANQLEPVLFSIRADALKKGTNTIRIEADGTIPVRVQAELTYFETGNDIPATVSGIQLSRDYYRVSRFPTLLSGPRIVYSPIEDGEAVAAGEEILVRMVIETAEDIHYLMIEDAKPAGFESLEMASGFGDPIREIIGHAPLEDTVYSGREQWIQIEPRDQTRTSFIDRLPQGIWELRFRYRAETPGHYHALPALVEPMYYPRIRGTSAEKKIKVDHQR